MPTPTESRHLAFGLQLTVRHHAAHESVASATPWLLLHGFLDQSASWDEVASLLSRTGPVLAPDQRGFGCSDHVGAGGYYHFSDYVLDVDHLLRNLGIPRVRLLGHSMGATVASMFAAMRPEAVESLHLIDGLGPAHMDPASAAEQLARHLRTLESPRAHKRMASVQEAADRMRRALPALGPEQALRLASRVTRPDGDGWAWRWDPLHRSRSAVAFDGPRYCALLDRVQAPSQLVLAEKGWVRTLPDLDERVRRLGARTLHWPGGHNPHVEDPVALTEMLLQQG